MTKAMARARRREVLDLGGPNDPVRVRHLTLAGSNVEIGAALGELAINRYGLRSEALLGDGRYVRARRSYFQRNYPAHAWRMRGVAMAFGLCPEDDRYDFSILPFGCEAISASRYAGRASYSPPWAASAGNGSLLRSFQVAPSPLDLYVMEWHPRRGAYPAIAVHVCDLLAGALHGINRAGLALSVVGVGGEQGPSCREFVTDDFPVRAVGIHELQLARLLLDTCATVDEAQSALLGARDIWIIAPTRYLVADSSGRSFEYDGSAGRTAQILSDGAGEPQSIVTLGACGESTTAPHRATIIRDGGSVDGVRTQPSTRGWRCRVLATQGVLSLELTIQSNGVPSSDPPAKTMSFSL